MIFHDNTCDFNSVHSYIYTEENVELQGEITKTLLSELKRLLRKTKQLSADELATEYKVCAFVI